MLGLGSDIFLEAISTHDSYIKVALERMEDSSGATGYP